MKVEGVLFAGISAFLLMVTAVYWLLSRDPTGTTALGLSGGLAFIVGYYLLFTARRIDTRPEDLVDAEISDGAGELGFYSPHSWWPLPVAFFAATTFLGIIIGWWLVIIGVIGGALAVIGLVFEYYRGEPAL